MSAHVYMLSGCIYADPLFVQVIEKQTYKCTYILHT
jgi:hypothetical protein